MLLLLSFGFAQASCPLKLDMDRIQNEMGFNQEQLISVSDIHTMVQQSKGCLTLIELWASWCGPCRQIAPEVNTIATQNEHLLVLQISSDSSSIAMRQFYKKHPPLSPAWRLESWNLEQLKGTYDLFGASFPARIPYFVLIDTDGTILLELTEPTNLNKLQSVLEQHQSQEKNSNTPVSK
ncbi:MAG: hypothetical protein CMK59_09605 [Proteobacteria bacterium]|nr:hypothetical protein [Pseudomonadota bacterium]